jgi:hypothetical protein
MSKKQAKISSRKPNPDEKLTLIVDIESVGADIHVQPVLAIGWIVCNKNTREIFEKKWVSFKLEDSHYIHNLGFNPFESETFRFFEKNYIRVDNDNGGWIFAKKCYEEFWLKQDPKLLETILSAALPPEKAMKEFLSVDEKYNIFEVMSDNPAFDLTRIDMAISRYHQKNYGETGHCRNYGMHYSPSGEYRWVSNPADAVYFLPKEYRNKIHDKTGAHTHFPDDDALDIYNLYIGLEDVKKEIFKGKKVGKSESKSKGKEKSKRKPKNEKK